MAIMTAQPRSRPTARPLLTTWRLLTLRVSSDSSRAGVRHSAASRPWASGPRMPNGGSSTDIRLVRQTGPVNSDSPKAAWAEQLPAGPPLRDDLARLVDADGGRDDAENSYFESANDPQFVAKERAQRRFKGQLRRRLRHRESRDREMPSE